MSKEEITRKILTKDFDEKYQSVPDNVLRYSVFAIPKNYERTYNKFKKVLYKLGYKQVSFYNKCTDPKEKEKSIVTKYVSPDDYVFEIQFHTPAAEE